MSRIVKKFGGTSLRDDERISVAVANVIEGVKAGDQVVAVVSAMGRKGDPYATDTFIDLLKDISPELDPLKKDLLISCGEIISAAIFAHNLESQGYTAVPMTGFQAGIYTNDNFGNAQILGIDTVRIEQELANDKIVVLAGFQGITLFNQVTTLGRGGSDTTALEVGGCLGADLVEIYTDVPGVAVTDPSIISEAKFFPTISRKALYGLAVNGAKVIHPRAVGSAIKHQIPFKIKCPWHEETETLVDETSPENMPIGIAVKKELSILRRNKKEIKREEYENLKQDIHYIETGKGEGLLLIPKEQQLPTAESHKAEDNVALVTVVCTQPRFEQEIRDKILAAISGQPVLYRVDDKRSVQFVIKEDNIGDFVEKIYSEFYVG